MPYALQTKIKWVACPLAALLFGEWRNAQFLGEWFPGEVSVGGFEQDFEIGGELVVSAFAEVDEVVMGRPQKIEDGLGAAPSGLNSPGIAPGVRIGVRA